MAPKWPKCRVFSDPVNPKGGVELRNNPQHSITAELQNRNGYQQSTNPDHGERILEDIANKK
jgi:hypothetical protein